jgi:NAD(P)H-hydrate epimerase
MADKTVKGETFIHATYTLCFQRMKRCMLMAENASALGEVHVLSIGLHPGFETNHESPYQLLSDLTITSLLKVRNRFAHKGNYGHALLIGGSEGKMGAVLLAVSAMLRSGVGLATAYVPGCGKKILPVSSPEAMTEFDSNEQLISQLPKNPEKYSAIGIGPGLGTDPATAIVVEKIINESEAPLIIDADALNILSKNKKLLSELPKGSILTPHPKEWERLCGTSANDFERHRLVVEKAGEWNCVIILKGHHTLVAGPDGKSRYNTTGNPGMAKGGSGDVLTGLLTGLIASGYSAHDASLIGVYLHGLAGDQAASKLSEEAMKAGDLIDFLPSAWQKLKSTSS